MEGERDPEVEDAAQPEAAGGAASDAAGEGEDAAPLGAVAAMAGRGAKGSKGPRPEEMGVSTTMTAQPDGSFVPGEVRVAEVVLAPGARIGRYEVKALLGRGGMGTVYRAQDRELGRDVALKCLDSERLGIEETRARLRREARAMARVEHAGVVRIYDVSSEGEQLFVAMELCTGGTLAEWLSGQRRGWRQIVAVFAAAGHGLAALHRAGLIHRDVKPGNLLLDERGQAKVTDFGLARPPHPPPAAEGAAAPVIEQDAEIELTDITRAGGLVGTPAYMAPEQLAREPLDARADQFSFCVALWEALCGRRPFERASVAGSALTPREILRAIDRGAEVPPGPNVAAPRRVLALVRRGLARNPEARWASMDELVAALERAARWPRRLLMPGLVAAAALGAALLFAWRGDGAGPPAERAPQLDEVQVVARAVDQHLAVAMLRDGQYVYLKRGELSVGPPSGEEALALAGPPGLRPLAVQRSGAAGWVVVRAHQQGAGCSWWHVPLDGGSWRSLLADEACAEPLDVAVAPGGDRLAIGDAQGILVRALAASDGGESRRLLEGTAAWTLAWSPDGGRLAASTGREAIVVDVASGAQRPLRGAVARGDMWLDDNRLMYLGSRNYLHSQVRLLDLRTGSDVVALELDGIVEQLDATAQRIMVFRREPHSLLYSTPVPTAAPPALDELLPLETGSTIDFLPAGWTADGSVISLALVGGRRGLVRTRAGERGVPLLLHQTAGINLMAAAGDKIFYAISRGLGRGPGRGPGRGLGREQRVFEISSGQDQQWYEGESARPTSMSCASAAARCLVIGEKNSWLDLKTMRLTPIADAAWRFEPFEAVSPDAAETARLRGDAVVLRALADGSETIVTPQPALAGLTKVWWSHDGKALLLIAQPRTPGGATDEHQVVRLARDGRWQALLKDGLRAFDGVLLSPDGGQLAFTAQLNKLTWSTWGWRAGR